MQIHKLRFEPVTVQLQNDLLLFKVNVALTDLLVWMDNESIMHLLLPIKTQKKLNYDRRADWEFTESVWLSVYKKHHVVRSSHKPLMHFKNTASVCTLWRFLKFRGKKAGVSCNEFSKGKNKEHNFKSLWLLDDMLGWINAGSDGFIYLIQWVQVGPWIRLWPLPCSWGMVIT